MSTIPSHRRPGGGFRDPWKDRPAGVPGAETARGAPTAGGAPPAAHSPAAPGGVNGNGNGRAHGGSFLRWRWDRIRNGVPADPEPGSLPVAQSEPAYPRATPGELRVTWVGHSTFLVQFGGLNVLTDPVWSRRCSPVQWAGPQRLVRPGIRMDELPRIDAVVLSHDHYDHLDEPTVRTLARRWPALQWVTPLGYREWLGRRGARAVAECDWWEEAAVAGDGGGLRFIALPARHWSARGPWSAGERLWAAWALVAPGGQRFLFGGDSGYFPELPELARRAGPFDAAALPIGAYDPSWFMRPVHMNPEEAVTAYRALDVRGPFIPMHWGTFRLSDEPPLEPPERLRAAWGEAGLPPDDLWILSHGETRARRLAARPREAVRVG